MNRRGAAALTFTLAAGLALSACSSSSIDGSGSPAGAGSSSSSSSSASSSTPSSPASGAVSAAALTALLQKGVSDIRTAQLQLSVDSGGVTITGSGKEKIANGTLSAADITEKLPGGVGGVVRVIIVDGKTYAKLPHSLSKSSKPYLLISDNSGNPTVRALAATLSQTLSSASIAQLGNFTKAATSVRKVGSATVAGQPVTRYKFDIDVAKLPTTLPGSSALSQSGLSKIPEQLDLDGHDRPVQIVQQFTVKGRQVSTRITVGHYNEPVSISAPPKSEVSTD